MGCFQWLGADAKMPEGVEMIKVVWHDRKIYVAGTFNRHLCVWRLLALCKAVRLVHV